MSDILHEHFWACWWLVFLVVIIGGAYVRDIFVVLARSMRSRP